EFLLQVFIGAWRGRGIAVRLLVVAEGFEERTALLFRFRIGVGAFLRRRTVLVLLPGRRGAGGGPAFPVGGCRGTVGTGGEPGPEPQAQRHGEAAAEDDPGDGGPRGGFARAGVLLCRWVVGADQVTGFPAAVALLHRESSAVALRKSGSRAFQDVAIAARSGF